MMVKVRSLQSLDMDSWRVRILRSRVYTMPRKSKAQQSEPQWVDLNVHANLYTVCINHPPSLVFTYHHVGICMLLQWKLDHIPSSCIVIMVHDMVKVVNIVCAQSKSTSHIDTGASWNPRATLDLNSDKFWCFNYRRWTRQCRIASECQVGSWHCT